MAAFYSAFLADSVSSPHDDPVKNPGYLDELFTDMDQFCAHQPLFHQEGTCINTTANERSCCIEQQGNSDTPPLVTQKQRSESFTSSVSMAEKGDSGEQVNQLMVPLDKKRKSDYGSSSNSANSKEVRQGKWKKQKGSKEATKGVKNDKGEEQARKEPPEGYIHVRAKRGQATDSHSLAERARREKISQKMKTLQALVPGCDKVTGKALMLDEIINYVQSLQNQVEFLSMKLASLDPMVYIFGLMNHDAMMAGLEDAGSSYWGLDDVQQQSNTFNNQFTFGANNNFLYPFH